jgi:hypothetical protein
MSNNKTILKTAALMISALTVAGMSVGSDQLVAVVIAGLFTNVASNFVGPLTERLRNALIRRHPNELNHDLQYALSEAVVRALNNLIVLYKEACPDKKINKSGLDFMHDLKKEATDLLDPMKTSVLSEEELKTYLYVANDSEPYDALINQLNAGLLPSDTDPGFPVFFKENFLLQVQFSFAQVLKEKDYDAAKTAFQTMVLEEIRSGVHNLLDDQQKLSDKIDNLAHQQILFQVSRLTNTQKTELNKLLKDLNRPQKFKVIFDEALEQKFLELNNAVNHIKSDTMFIRNNVRQLSRTVPVILRAVLVVIAFAVAAIIVIWYQQKQNDFSTSVALVKDPAVIINNDYPSLNRSAILILVLPGGKREVPVKSDMTADLVNLTYKLKGDRVRFELVDDFWELSNDSAVLEKTSMSLKIKPNNILAAVQGKVYSNAGNIAGATVTFEGDTILTTDRQGWFHATLLPRMLKKLYTVTASAPGFVSQTRYYDPRSIPLQFKLDNLKPSP